MTHRIVNIKKKQKQKKPKTHTKFFVSSLINKLQALQSAHTYNHEQRNMKENEKSKRNYVQKTRKSLVYFCCGQQHTCQGIFQFIIIFNFEISVSSLQILS